MARRFLETKTISRGIRAKIITVKGMLMVQRIIKAPKMLTMEMKKSSGPWWANSEISIKSLIMRDMMVPVLFSSK